MIQGGDPWHMIVLVYTLLIATAAVALLVNIYF
jgi:hypothetical protein